MIIFLISLMKGSVEDAVFGLKHQLVTQEES